MKPSSTNDGPVVIRWLSIPIGLLTGVVVWNALNVALYLLVNDSPTFHSYLLGFGLNFSDKNTLTLGLIFLAILGGTQGLATGFCFFINRSYKLWNGLVYGVATGIVMALLPPACITSMGGRGNGNVMLVAFLFCWANGIATGVLSAVVILLFSEVSRQPLS